jgi:hypothetical protein
MQFLLNYETKMYLGYTICHHNLYFRFPTLAQFFDLFSYNLVTLVSASLACPFLIIAIISSVT